jgi:hypothetical protein
MRTIGQKKSFYNNYYKILNLLQMGGSNMKKKSLAILLSVVMIVAAFPASIFASSEFSDMPTNWSTAALQKAVSNGLLKGSN